MREYRLIETICRVAIGIFAAYTSPILFFAALGIGVAAALAERAWTGTIVRAAEKNRPVCTQGYMETLSGRRYSDKFNLTVTALFIGVHAHCMPRFYVPLCGATIGVWATDQLVDAGSQYLNRHANRCPVLGQCAHSA